MNKDFDEQLVSHMIIISEEIYNHIPTFINKLLYFLDGLILEVVTDKGKIIFGILYINFRI